MRMRILKNETFRGYKFKSTSDSSDVLREARVTPRWAPNNSERNNEPLQILQQTIPVIARLQRKD